MNEHVVAGGRRPAENFEILCECADANCIEHLRVPTESYERTRVQPTDFLLKPGHNKPEFETVIDSHEDFAVVRKSGEAVCSTLAGDNQADSLTLTPPTRPRKRRA